MCGSISEVASSSTRVCGSATTSRASAICWAWAGVSLDCPEPSTVSSLRGSRDTQSQASTVRSASITTSSGESSRARMMLSRTLPTKTWCSWVTSATSVRSTSSGSAVSSTPPTVTDPVRGPLIPASNRPSVDLPDPLGPTIASRSPGRSARSTPCSTS